MQHLKINLPAKIKLSESLVLEGDSLNILRMLPSNSVQCVITSPPYWGLRDYNIKGQIGLESSLQEFINHLVGIFNELKRVLRDDGTLWLNIGDGYTSGNRGYRASDKKNPARAMSLRPNTPEGLKPKDLQGIPWRLAFALQDDGWYLRSDIIWNKPNAQPESVKDRPTKSHEYLFMLTKAEQYYYNYEASKEIGLNGNHRNRRTVWNINTQSFSDAHFATFPTTLAEPCVFISSKPGDFVLDPFFGSGTVGVVCAKNDRHYVGIELNPEYVDIAARRLGLAENNIMKVAV
ncbi:MAG: site-specific DNA-methyltransferase [Treponema sp.]|jgi:site-specific DNA-methyltransferase (adenine-specific)|nr:site-specific DNA-methyltransferase [Treponema sp.]